jgi:hypothetical protein
MDSETDFDVGPAWLICTVLVWLVAFGWVFSEGKDYSGDDQFTVSDVGGVARDATVGWLDRRPDSKPCEPQTTVERFFETSECEIVGELKWLIALIAFSFGGYVLAIVVWLYHWGRRLLTKR